MRLTLLSLVLILSSVAARAEQVQYLENFDDAKAPDFVVKSPVTPISFAAVMQDGVYLLKMGTIAQPSVSYLNYGGLPSAFTVSAQVQYGYYLTTLDWLKALAIGEGVLVFDYQDNAHFKWAGLIQSGGTASTGLIYDCVIGNFNLKSSNAKVVKGCAKATKANYVLSLAIDGSTVSLLVDGVSVIADYDFLTPLNSGNLGMGTVNPKSGYEKRSFAKFDNFSVSY